MSWSISPKTLILLIQSLNSNERELLRTYAVLQEQISKYEEVEYWIMETISEMSYFENQLQESTSLSEQMRESENYQKKLYRSINFYEEAAKKLESKLSTNSLSGVKFLARCSVGYDDTETILSTFAESIATEDFYSSPGNIHEMCEFVWSQSKDLEGMNE